MQKENILLAATRKLFLTLFFVTLALFASNCSSPSISETNLTAVHPTFTASPISPSTVVPTETNTVTPEPESLAKTNCQDIISSQLQNSSVVDGSIIFEGECGGQTGLYKLTLGDRQIMPFHHAMDSDGRTIPMTFFVSRDHQWLMYENNSYDKYDNHLETRLLITGEDESSKLEYPVDGNWLAPMGWYGDHLVVYSVLRAPDSTLTLFNPFTGKVTMFYYPFQGFIRDEIYFDPPLARVLYFDEDGDVSRYILKEITSDKILWQSMKDQMVSNFAGWPNWSPNGLFFALPVWDQTSQGKYKMMVVSREGKESILGPTFQSYLNSPYVSFDWSPSGNYLVFWDDVANVGKQLIIWDAQNNQLIHSSFTTQGDPELPVFSPDEQQFMIRVRIPTDDDTDKAVNYLVDTTSGNSVKLDLGLSPVAWLKLLESDQQLPLTENETGFIPPKSGSGVKQQCLEESDADQTHPPFQGEIVFSRDRYLSSLRPGKELQEVQIEKNQIIDAFASPDRKSLFYWYRDENDNFTPHYWLSLSDGQKTEIEQPDIIPEPDMIGGWFNDHEFWVNTRSSVGRVLLDPFENTYREPPEFADPQMAGCVDWLICPYADEPVNFYDTKFEREIFSTASSVHMIDRNANFLWQYENWLITLNLPKWSPDEQYLGVPLPKDDNGEHYEFFTVDRDGNARQLTNYSSAYSTMRVDKFRWSPDERFIAFWGDTHSKEGVAQLDPYRLFVLDTESHQTTDYCVVGDYKDNKAPVWSPDGSQIVVNAVRGDQQSILLVDFEAGTVTQLADGELVGWMTAP